MAITQAGKNIIKMTAANDALTENIDILFLHWYSKGASAGDDLLVVDADGDTVWQEVADGSNFSRIFPIKNRINKLKVSTIDTGTLYVVRAVYHGGVAW